MLDRIRKWVPGKRNWRRTYIVHFIAYNGFDLPLHIETLRNSYNLSIIKGGGTNAQSIEIRMRPRQLREMQAALPPEVLVAAELKEPKKH